MAHNSTKFKNQCDLAPAISETLQYVTLCYKTLLCRSSSVLTLVCDLLQHVFNAISEKIRLTEGRGVAGGTSC